MTKDELVKQLKARGFTFVPCECGAAAEAVNDFKCQNRMCKWNGQYAH